MISNAPIISSSPLSILVVLSDGIPAAPGRPGNRSSFSGSGNFGDGTWSSGYKDDVERLLTQSRRLSLAAGVGSGFTSVAAGSAISTSPPTPPLGSAALRPLSSYKTSPSASRSSISGPSGGAVPSGGADPSSSPSPTSRVPPPFGEKRAARPGMIRSKSRPATTTTSNDTFPHPGLMNARASVAMPSGTNLFSATGRRVGAEGDELVDVLRQSGLEVTAVRQVSHLPSILSPPQTSSAGSTPRSTGTSTPAPPAQQVILVPLGETPSLPSLSLLLNRGTTPSAVCFQQDLVDRARQIEDDWLSIVVRGIDQVADIVNEQRDNANTNASAPTPSSENTVKPIIIAYSANGGVSPNAIATCAAHGASGVLQPPYGPTTAQNLTELVATGNASPAAQTASITASPSIKSIMLEDETKVVLTPTALSMGAEHETEKVLMATLQRRRISTQLNLSRMTSRGSTVSFDNVAHAEQSPEPPLVTAASTLSTAGTVATPSTAPMNVPSLPSPLHFLDPLLAAHPAFDASRRRSVDTGGIALAFDRATKWPTEYDELPTTPLPSGLSNLVAGDKEQEAADGNTTQFAEVLGEMYQQTMTSIDIQMGDYDTLAAPISFEDRVRLVQCLSTWDFRPHTLSQHDLFRVACLIFEAILHTEGIAELCIKRDQINRLLFAIRAIYHAPNPYHNYVHAIDVLQATYLFLMSIGVAPPFSFLLELEPGKSVWRRPTEDVQPPLGHGTRRAREILRPQDVLGIIMAAIGHDVGHPGLSNAFMKNAKVPLSVVYDDKSVLENMHCMLIVQLLRKHGFGFLLGPPSAAEVAEFPARASIESRDFRRVLYSAILATDMALHFAWIQRLKEFAEAMHEDNSDGSRDAQDEHDRVMLSQALIKCADISNPTRPIEVSEHWSTVLLDEWTKQASLEQELSLPVSVVAGVDARLQAKGQVGFIDLFTEPLFRTIAEALPELEPYAESCRANRGTWQKRFEHLEEDSDENEAKTAVLRTAVHPPTTPSTLDDRFHTLFPLILPATLVSPEASTAHAAAAAHHQAQHHHTRSHSHSHSHAGNSSPESPTTATTATPPRSPAYPPVSPAAHAVRVVYRGEVHDRSMLARHVLALTGFDATGTASNRRMSTPEALLVHGLH